MKKMLMSLAFTAISTTTISNVILARNSTLSTINNSILNTTNKSNNHLYQYSPDGNDAYEVWYKLWRQDVIKIFITKSTYEDYILPNYGDYIIKTINYNTWITKLVNLYKSFNYSGSDGYNDYNYPAYNDYVYSIAKYTSKNMGQVVEFFTNTASVNRIELSTYSDGSEWEPPQDASN